MSLTAKSNKPSIFGGLSKKEFQKTFQSNASEKSLQDLSKLYQKYADAAEKYAKTVNEAEVKKFKNNDKQAKNTLNKLGEDLKQEAKKIDFYEKDPNSYAGGRRLKPLQELMKHVEDQHKKLLAAYDESIHDIADTISDATEKDTFLEESKELRDNYEQALLTKRENIVANRHHNVFPDAKQLGAGVTVISSTPDSKLVQYYDDGKDFSITYAEKTDDKGVSKGSLEIRGFEFTTNQDKESKNQGQVERIGRDQAGKIIAAYEDKFQDEIISGNNTVNIKGCSPGVTALIAEKLLDKGLQLDSETFKTLDPKAQLNLRQKYETANRQQHAQGKEARFDTDDLKVSAGGGMPSIPGMGHG